MVDVFLLLAARTAVGKYLGSLAEVPAPQLGAGAITVSGRRRPGGVFDTTRVDACGWLRQMAVGRRGGLAPTGRRGRRAPHGDDTRDKSTKYVLISLIT
jgi:hypothetical protein